jgi:predicted PurR-regulated permease PerM
MNNSESTIILDPQKIAYWTVILLGMMAMLIYGKTLIIPIVLGVFLAVILSSIRQAVKLIPVIGKYLNDALVSVITLLVLVTIVLILSQALSSQVEEFTEFQPLYEERFNHLVAMLGDKVHFDVTTFGASSQFAGLLGWFGESISLVLSNVLLTFMFTMFLMAEQKMIPQKLASLAGTAEKAKNVQIVWQDIANSIQTYISLKSIISALTGVATFAVLELMGVHFAAMWGILVFFINFIPNLGSILGVALPALHALLQFEQFTPVLIIVGLLTVVQFVIGNLIEPAYLGTKLNLSPFIVLVSLTFWGAIWGLVGMFLAVPLMVLVSLICRRISGLEWISTLLSIDGKR